MADLGDDSSSLKDFKEAFLGACLALESFQAHRKHEQSNFKLICRALKMLAKVTMLLLGGLKLAPGPCVFTILYFKWRIKKLDGTLTRSELIG
eukprot:644335-Pelagomonas_calceolata.AAC.2